ncbi:MAG: MATE family efflux transporter [Eubacteriales bacterium]|nr:MATE family efflux transporter [Eubacteriales bacterium]
MKLENKEFYKSLFTLVMPIALQNLLSAAVGSADVVMLGFVGQTALAAVSLANQIQMIMWMFFAGLGSGIMMLVAQYWGKGDTKSVEKIFGVSLRFSICVGLVFSGTSCFFPEFLMRIYTDDPALIAEGAKYLQIVGVSFLVLSFSQMYLNTIKSLERVKKATMMAASSLLTNVFFNAVFIFGWFGMPKLGVFGVGLATLMGRTVELIWCVIDSKRNRVLRLRFSAVFRPTGILTKDFWHYSWPAMSNEAIWGAAFSMYAVIMGHLSADLVAANAVVTVVRDLAMVVGMGVAYGGAIMLGKEMGQSHLEEAKRCASKLCRVALLCGVVGGLGILLLRPVIFNVVTTLNETATQYLSSMLYISSYYVIGVIMNTTVICGVFRSGGDSRFGVICDAIDMWCVMVPIGFLCAFVFKLPPMTVYFILCLDEFIKMPVVYAHYKRYKWMKNITRDMPEDTPAIAE